MILAKNIAEITSKKWLIWLITSSTFKMLGFRFPGTILVLLRTAPPDQLFASKWHSVTWLLIMFSQSYVEDLISLSNVRGYTTRALPVVNCSLSFVWFIWVFYFSLDITKHSNQYLTLWWKFGNLFNH